MFNDLNVCIRKRIVFVCSSRILLESVQIILEYLPGAGRKKKGASHTVHSSGLSVYPKTKRNKHVKYFQCSFREGSGKWITVQSNHRKSGNQLLENLVSSKFYTMLSVIRILENHE